MSDTVIALGMMAVGFGGAVWMAIRQTPKEARPKLSTMSATDQNHMILIVGAVLFAFVMVAWVGSATQR